MPAIAADIHARLLNAFVDGRELPADTSTLAAQYRLLPLYLDWVGFVGLRADGELLFVSWDPPHEPEVVRESHLRRAALVRGAEEFTELASLRPVRTADAIDCPHCGGTGRPTVEGRPVPENILCFCGGLGWIFKEEAESPKP
jgi:hypothetical protein